MKTRNFLTTPLRSIINTENFVGSVCGLRHSQYVRDIAVNNKCEQQLEKPVRVNMSLTKHTNPSKQVRRAKLLFPFLQFRTYCSNGGSNWTEVSLKLYKAVEQYHCLHFRADIKSLRDLISMWSTHEFNTQELLG